MTITALNAKIDIQAALNEAARLSAELPLPAAGEEKYTYGVPVLNYTVTSFYTPSARLAGMPEFVIGLARKEGRQVPPEIEKISLSGSCVCAQVTAGRVLQLLRWYHTGEVHHLDWESFQRAGMLGAFVSHDSFAGGSRY